MAGNLSPRVLIDSFYTAMDTTFKQGITDTVSQLQFSKLVKIVNSTDEKSLYHFKDFMPGLIEIAKNQPFTFANLSTNNFEVYNRTFGQGFSIAKEDFEDNNVGDYAEIATDLAKKATLLKDQLPAELFDGAFTTTKTFDAQPWCGTHSIGLTTFTNVVEGALTADHLVEAIKILRSIKIKMDKENKPTPANQGNLHFTVIVSPKNENPAEMILKAPLVNGGDTNTNYNKADLLVTNWLADENEDNWFLVIDNMFKPIYYQDRQKPVIYKDTDETSMTMFTKRKYDWGVDARAAALPTFPWLICGGKPAATT